MQEDEELEAKQKYLRHNIMEQGYDADHFMMWMDKHFEHGSLLSDEVATLSSGRSMH